MDLACIQLLALFLTSVVAEPAGIWPLNQAYLGDDVSGNQHHARLANVVLAEGVNGEPGGAYELEGTESSFIVVPPVSQIKGQQQVVRFGEFELTKTLKITKM